MHRKQHFYIVTSLDKEHWFDEHDYLRPVGEQFIGMNVWPYTLKEAKAFKLGMKIFKVGLPFNNFIKQVE